VPTVKNGDFPLPEVKVSELPSRIRIAQFLILPSHSRSGHGNQLYTTIHAACIADPTVVELTVEDPNEQFDALRDTADYTLLQPEFLKHNVNLNPDPLGSFSQKKRPRVVPTSALIPTKLLQDIRTSFKIETTQFAHILEMYLLGQIPKSHRLAGGTNIARLLIKKYKATDENDRRYYWWRMLTKQRLYKKHKELLNELELLDRVEKLDATVQNVEEGYEITLDALEDRLSEGGAEDGEGSEGEWEDLREVGAGSRDKRVKRKLTVMDEEDEEDEAGLSKRPKI
jgi:histone acetyltransferase 1